MRALGLDLGQKRVGVAVSDSAGALAMPIEVLSRLGDRPREHRAIAELVEEWEAELSDCGEQFPAKGPYQCDICQDITMMKEDFVSHMKKDPRRTD